MVARTKSVKPRADVSAKNKITLPETNIAHENPIFPGKYHQNGGFSMAMLVYRSVLFASIRSWKDLIAAVSLRSCFQGVTLSGPSGHSE